MDYMNVQIYIKYFPRKKSIINNYILNILKQPEKLK